MKKITILILVIFSGMVSAFSQSSLASVSYNKISQPALMLELPYNEGMSEDFIITNLKKTGYDPETKGKLFWKQNKLDGFYIFKEVRLEGAGQPLDLYFRVDQKSKKEKNESIIYLLVSKGGESFISPDTDDKIYDAAKSFLNGFISQAADYKLDLDVKGQEEIVKNAEKKLNKLEDNEKDMIKKIKDLEDDLRKNKKDQEDQQKTIENEKKKLEDLKSKVKN